MNPQLPPKPLQPEDHLLPGSHRIVHVKERWNENGFTRQRLVRTKETGDKVFWIEEEFVFKNGIRRWIKNVPTLERMGFNLGDEQTIPYNDLKRLEELTPFDESEEVTIQKDELEGIEKDTFPAPELNDVQQKERQLEPKQVIADSDSGREIPDSSAVREEKLSPVSTSTSPNYDGENYTIVGEPGTVVQN